MPDDPLPAADDEEADLCTCGLDIHDNEATDDADLPAAAGGLEPVAATGVADEETDACDLASDGADAMPDEELPVAQGGVS